MQELEDPFVGQNVQHISSLRIDDGQPVDLISEQGIDGIKKAKEERIEETTEICCLE